MAAAVEAQLDAVMGKAFSLETFSYTCVDEQIDGSLLQQARADTLFDVFPGSRFENDGFDPLQVEQVGEHQARRTCPYNADLRAHVFPFALMMSPKLRAV
jgi:hypothetical protein